MFAWRAAFTCNANPPSMPSIWEATRVHYPASQMLNATAASRDCAPPRRSEWSDRSPTKVRNQIQSHTLDTFLRAHNLTHVLVLRVPRAPNFNVDKIWVWRLRAFVRQMSRNPGHTPSNNIEIRGRRGTRARRNETGHQSSCELSSANSSPGTLLLWC